MNQQLYDQGLATRREVLGGEYVDAAIANADDFTRPLQDLITQFAWGEIWNRPGLDRRTGSERPRPPRRRRSPGLKPAKLKLASLHSPPYM